MQVTDAMVEAGCIGMYGKNWNGPPDRQPGEAMKNVWRKYARDCLTAALAEMWRPVNAPADMPQDGMYLAANDHNQVAMIEARNGYRIVHNMPGFVDWAPVCNLVAFMPLPAPPMGK